MERSTRKDEAQVIEEWVEQCRQGRTRAYAEIVRALQPQVLGFLYRMTRDREWAEDLGQEVFLRAYRRLERYDRNKAAFSTWLFTMARNLCLDELRKSRPQRVALEEAAETQAAGDPGPDAALRENELERLIAEAVQSLAAEYREVFILKEYQDFSLEEIAAIVQCPIGTVKSRLHRARTQLQKQLSPILSA